MQYKEERNRITIAPTNEVEIAYIEEVFGLKRDGDAIELVRKNAMNLSCIAYLETKIKPQPRDVAVAWKPSTIAEMLDNSSMPDEPAKQINDMAYKVHQDITKVTDTDREMLEAALVAAVRNKKYVRIASLATLLISLED